MDRCRNQRLKRLRLPSHHDRIRLQCVDFSHQSSRLRSCIKWADTHSYKSTLFGFNFLFSRGQSRAQQFFVRGFCICGHSKRTDVDVKGLRQLWRSTLRGPIRARCCELRRMSRRHFAGWTGPWQWRRYRNRRFDFECSRNGVYLARGILPSCGLTRLCILDYNCACNWHGRTLGFAQFGI